MVGKLPIRSTGPTSRSRTGFRVSENVSRFFLLGQPSNSQQLWTTAKQERKLTVRQRSNQTVGLTKLQTTGDDAHQIHTPEKRPPPQRLPRSPQRPRTNSTNFLRSEPHKTPGARPSFPPDRGQSPERLYNPAKAATPKKRSVNTWRGLGARQERISRTKKTIGSPSLPLPVFPRYLNKQELGKRTRRNRGVALRLLTGRWAESCLLRRRCSAACRPFPTSESSISLLRTPQD